ncbi:hypothetical protein [Pseudoalteromonas sp. 68 DY56-GL68]|uniref:hypothetical protein n=1 Tax=Pseudoalteromonas sp. 68 DY56-GL68 TaxID=2974919 RepID=UPI00352AB9D2
MQTQQNEEQTIDPQTQALAQQAERDAEMNAAARSLDGDFDPANAGIADEAPQAKSETEQLSELLQDDGGSLLVVTDLITTYEALLQQFGHHKFKIEDERKAHTAERVAPVVKKYGHSLSGAFGDYKEELIAALAVGGLVHGSIKQIKELKAIDAAKEVKPTETANDAANSDSAEAESEPEHKEAA